MHSSFFRFLVLIFTTYSIFNPLGAGLFEGTKDLPIAYQARFRSMESASRLWLFDLYHNQTLKKEDLASFRANNSSALDLLWRIHFLGHASFETAPFFWIHYASLKTVLGLDLAADRFNFKTLYRALYENEETNLAAVKFLLISEAREKYQQTTNLFQKDKVELDSLSSGLWITNRSKKLILIQAPSNPPWHFLKSGIELSDNSILERDLENGEKNSLEELKTLFQHLNAFLTYKGSAPSEGKSYEEFYADLQRKGAAPQEIAQILEERFPFRQRLLSSGNTLLMLPSKVASGEFISLHALKLKKYDKERERLSLSDNFTVFSDSSFFLLREAYLKLEEAVLSKRSDEEIRSAANLFSNLYLEAYKPFEGKAYKKAYGKILSYPTELSLQAETLYYRVPFIEIAIISYLIALICLIFSCLIRQQKDYFYTRLALIFTIFGFLVQTTLLALRCFILQRPPVSNMFETIVYVPWIATALGFAFYKKIRSKSILGAALTASLILLVLLKLTQTDPKLENVQAVLDSQYWLIIHVLMVVGSYGAFAVCGILGHFYLTRNTSSKTPKESLEKISMGILYTMYVGVALLIPGTILGGVWAAESWGRFWDWDPKESWAFISACVYLLFIHAYTFHYIKDFGLAVGSIAGLIAISFTWYGVNYILGTGLHSYGFGTGGTSFYLLYLLAEGVFILAMTLQRQRTDVA